MKRLITPRIDQCIGCHSCSLACARIVYRKISWNTAGIRIHSTGGLSTSFVANRCLACDPAPCVESCETNALRQRQGGGVVFRKKKCNGCGDCVTACPVDGIFQDTQSDIYVCIHCGGCVEFCPQDCLEMIEVSDIEGVLI